MTWYKISCAVLECHTYTSNTNESYRVFATMPQFMLQFQALIADNLEHLTFSVHKNVTFKFDQNNEDVSFLCPKIFFYMFCIVFWYLSKSTAGKCLNVLFTK